MYHTSKNGILLLAGMAMWYTASLDGEIKDIVYLCSIMAQKGDNIIAAKHVRGMPYDNYVREDIATDENTKVRNTILDKELVSYYIVDIDYGRTRALIYECDSQAQGMTNGLVKCGSENGEYMYDHYRIYVYKGQMNVDNMNVQINEKYVDQMQNAVEIGEIFEYKIEWKAAQEKGVMYTVSYVLVTDGYLENVEMILHHDIESARNAYREITKRYQVVGQKIDRLDNKSIARDENVIISRSTMARKTMK